MGRAFGAVTRGQFGDFPKYSRELALDLLPARAEFSGTLKESPELNAGF